MGGMTYLNPERIAARGDVPMGWREKLDEAEWLLDAGVHPVHVAAQLGTTLPALEKLARRHHRGVVSSACANEARAMSANDHGRAA